MRTIYFLVAMMLSIGLVSALDTATEITIISGDGSLVAAFDTPDSTMRANGIGNISYISESILTKNTTALGSEFIVDGPGARWNRYEIQLLPDRYGVKHELDLHAFDKINSGGIIEVGSDTGEQYFASLFDAIGAGGFGEEVIMRGVGGKLVDQERVYVGDMIEFDGRFSINSSVMEDCIELPEGEVDWIPCDFGGEGEVDWGYERGNCDNCTECESCSA